MIHASRNTGDGIGRALTVPALEAKKTRRNAAKKLRKQKNVTSSKIFNHK